MPLLTFKYCYIPGGILLALQPNPKCGNAIGCSSAKVATTTVCGTTAATRGLLKSRPIPSVKASGCTDERISVTGFPTQHGILWWYPVAVNELSMRKVCIGSHRPTGPLSAATTTKSEVNPSGRGRRLPQGKGTNETQNSLPTLSWNMPQCSQRNSWVVTLGTRL